MDEEETYSEEGIICPLCAHIHSPDEAFFYDEAGFDFNCESCNASLRVQPDTSTWWSTVPRKEGEK